MPSGCILPTMQTTEHAADTKLAEGYLQPAQQGGATAEALRSAVSVPTPNTAAVGGESGELLHAAGVSELRPLAAQFEGSLPAPFLIAAGAALSAELPTRGFSFGPQVLSGDRGIRTEAVVMGVADVRYCGAGCVCGRFQTVKTFPR